MGPRSADRGNGANSGGGRGATRLQWGRDQLIAEMQVAKVALEPSSMLQWGLEQMIAEILQPEREEPGYKVLQWGRDQLIAEIVIARLKAERKGPRFNGAAIS